MGDIPTASESAELKEGEAKPLTRREKCVLYYNAKTPADKAEVVRQHPELATIFSEVNHR